MTQNTQSWLLSVSSSSSIIISGSGVIILYPAFTFNIITIQSAIQDTSLMVNTCVPSLKLLAILAVVSPSSSVIFAVDAYLDCFWFAWTRSCNLFYISIAIVPNDASIPIHHATTSIWTTIDDEWNEFDVENWLLFTCEGVQFNVVFDTHTMHTD